MSEIARYESQAVAIRENLSIEEVTGQVHLIQQVMRSVMRDGEHYGTIPGCGKKPSLFKPGAEKLGLTFRIAPRYEVETIDLQDGHREYRVKTILVSVTTGAFLGEGVGSCSTLEGKYRYRPGPAEFSGRPVPKEYWDLRKSDPEKAQELLGGKGFSTKKNPAGQWEIVTQGERVDHDNPA